MNSHLDQGNQVNKRVLKEVAVLVCLWVFIGGTASFLLYKETIKAIESWVFPLKKVNPETSAQIFQVSVQKVSNLLTSLETYGAYVIVIVVLFASVLFWLSLRQILKAFSPDMVGFKDGERSDET